VVEDETDARELFESMLRHAGAVVESAASVPEAVALLATRPFVVLLSDLEMPGEDGFQLLAQARSHPREGGPRLIAIAVTAYARPVDRQRALDAGFDGHLTKPVDPAVVVATIASLVSGQP
jgi:CheY-like chemotaxis protein